MNKSAANFTPEEIQLLKNYLTGGVALGGGVGALMGVANMGMDLKRQADDEVKEDDDTLFLTLPKKAGIGPVAIGTGLAGGTLSLLAMNALVRKLFQAQKRKDVQSELDSAQRSNLAGLESLGKQAAAEGRSLGPSEYAGGGAVAAALLTALASGIISYKALGKYFPSVKQPANPLPRRVKILQQPAAQTPEAAPAPAPQEDEEKMAAAHELIVRMALTRSKAASGSLGDLASAFAQGRGDELTSMLSDFGQEAVFAACGGAHGIPVTKRAADLGITALVKSAALGPIAACLAASEIYDMYPALTVSAGAFPESDKKALWEFGAGLGQNFQDQTLAPVKSAAATEGSQPKQIERLIRQAILNENNHAGANDVKQMQAHMATGELLTGTSGESANSTDAKDSRDPNADQQQKELPEMVMGV